VHSPGSDKAAGVSLIIDYMKNSGTETPAILATSFIVAIRYTPFINLIPDNRLLPAEINPVRLTDFNYMPVRVI